MPWGPEDAARHTKKAKSAKSQRQWSHVADRVLESTGDEGRAVREANAVIARSFHGSAANYKHHRPKQKVQKRHF